MTHTYEENSVGMREPTLCVPQIPQRRLIITNGGGNFVPIRGGATHTWGCAYAPLGFALLLIIS
jgi:hypothetical protein